MDVEILTDKSAFSIASKGKWLLGGRTPWLSCSVEDSLNMSTPMMLDSSDDESQAMDVDETPIESLQKLTLEEIYPILRIFNTITYLLH